MENIKNKIIPILNYFAARKAYKTEKRVCSYPWTSLKIGALNDYCCCYAKQGSLASQTYFEKKRLDSKQTKLFSIWNSPKFQDLRKTMIEKGPQLSCGWHQDPKKNESNCATPINYEPIREGTKKQIKNDYKIIKSIKRKEIKVSHYPSIIEVWPDIKCNFKCKMCYLTKRRDEGLDDELNLESMKNELKEFFSHAREIFLTGGEPTHSPQYRLFLDIVEEANGGKIILITNGYDLIGKVLPALHLFQRVYVSIDAGTKETYEKIRIGSNWENLIKNLSELSNKKGESLHFYLTAVISKMNYFEMKEIIKMANRFGVNDISFMEAHGLDSLSPETREELVFSGTEIKGVLEKNLNDALDEATRLGVRGSYCLPSINQFGSFNY